MKGADVIVAMRMRRRKPAAVILTDVPALYGRPGSVLIEARDKPSADLRFVIDAKVACHFIDEARGAEFAGACVRAGASLVRWYTSADFKITEHEARA